MPTVVRVKKIRPSNLGSGVKSGRKTALRSTTRYSKGHRSGGVGSFRTLKRNVKKVVSVVKSTNKKALGVAQKIRNYIDARRKSKATANSSQVRQSKVQ